jgi:hypothetical protein
VYGSVEDPALAGLPRDRQQPRLGDAGESLILSGVEILRYTHTVPASFGRMTFLR